MGTGYDLEMVIGDELVSGSVGSPIDWHSSASIGKLSEFLCDFLF